MTRSVELDAGSDEATAHPRELEDDAIPLRIPTVELTDAIARRAGELEGVHQGSDTKARLGHGDAIVAATALEFDEPVVTTDADFETVESLVVSTP